MSTQEKVAVAMIAVGIFAAIYSMGKEAGMVAAGCECVEWETDATHYGDGVSVEDTYCVEWDCPK